MFHIRSWIYPFQQFDSFWPISLIVKKSNSEINDLPRNSSDDE